MGRLGIGELAIILVIVLMVFGPKKLPGLQNQWAKQLREFKKGQEDLEETLNKPAITKEEKTDGQVSEKIDQAQNNDK